MNNLPNPKTPVAVGQIAVDGDVVSTKIGTAIVPLTSGTMPSHEEADSQYFEMSNIPLTRVGDNTYLPLDVKADFKGAIQPWAELPYFLQEADGTLAGLRPGYNGEFARIFYAYSETGEFGPENVRMTDSEYRPLWLNPDEYINGIHDGNEYGFCVRIRSTTDLSLIRFYWVDHNSTLDSRFHTFLDITNNMNVVPSGFLSAASRGGVTYIREVNAVVLLLTNNQDRCCYLWFTVNRPFQSVRSPVVPAALPAKIVDWADLSGTLTGNSNQSMIFDAAGETNLAKYFKFIDEPAGRKTPALIHSPSGSRKLTYAIENGVIRFFTGFFCYLPYDGTSRAFSYTVHMDYTIATNRLRYNPVIDDPQQFQTLPWVFSGLSSPLINTGPPPSPITDRYKSCKYPLFVSPNTHLLLSNQVQKTVVVGTKLVTISVGTSQTTSFNASAQDLGLYSGSSLAGQKMDAYRRPYFQGPLSYPPYRSYYAYDASILSKALRQVRFIGPQTIAAQSASQLYGEVYSAKELVVGLPNTSTEYTVYSSDFNTMRSSMAIPSSVSLAPTYLNYPSTASFIDGNGPMVVSRAIWADIMGNASTAATWLAYNIHPATGIPAMTYAADPIAFKTKATELENSMIAQSTHVVAGNYTKSSCMQPIHVDPVGGVVHFLFTIAFGNNDQGIRFEYAIIRLSLVAGSVTWPAGSVTAAIVSKTAGSTQTGNMTSAQLTGGECIGAYKHTDGNFYVITHPPTFAGIVGGNIGEVRVFKLTSGFLFSSSALIAATSTWYQLSVGVHPTFGLYYTHTWVDSQAKAMMFYKDFRGVASQAARIQQVAEAWLAGAGATDTVFILSSRSAVGFVLYSSEISVFMNGTRKILPTQTIQLSAVTSEPANKTFYFYIQWNGTDFILKPSLTTIPESVTSTFIGTVVTGPTGIISTNLEKVTRLDTYRFGFEAPIVGSAIRTYENKPDIQGYVFDTTAEVNAFKATHVPPLPATIFSNWDRTNGAAFFPGGAGATGDAAAWTFATNPDRVVQPNNTLNVCSFISPKTYSEYDLEATLYSDHYDDDAIGLTVAFNREGSINYDLSVMRTCNGVNQAPTNVDARQWNFGFNLVGPTLPATDYPALQSKQVGAHRQHDVDNPSGWGVYAKVRVMRRGNIITAYTSNVSTTLAGVGDVLESSAITIDLSTVPTLAPLTGRAKYGFTTLSQSNATFYNIKFSGDLDTTRVIDVQANVVWKYNFGTSTWQQTAILPKDELGYVRTVTNPDTGNTYFVTQSAIIKQ